MADKEGKVELRNLCQFNSFVSFCESLNVREAM